MAFLLGLGPPAPLCPLPVEQCVQGKLPSPVCTPAKGRCISRLKPRRFAEWALALVGGEPTDVSISVLGGL